MCWFLSFIFYFLAKAVKIWLVRHALDGPTTHMVPYKEPGCWLPLRLPGHANHKPLPFRPTDQEGASRTRTSSAAIQVQQVLSFLNRRSIFNSWSTSLHPSGVHWTGGMTYNKLMTASVTALPLGCLLSKHFMWVLWTGKLNLWRFQL